jgi:hypothetical protein
MKRRRWCRPAETTWAASDDNDCRALGEWDRLDPVSMRVCRRWPTSQMVPTPAEPREMPWPTRSYVEAT